MADNPQAFPPNAGWRDNDVSQRGMTLLDYFAGQALPAVIAAGHWTLTGTGTVHDMLAQEAYRLAAAMLSERTTHDH